MITSVIVVAVIAFTLVVLFAIKPTRDLAVAAFGALGVVGFILFWVIAVLSSVAIPLAIAYLLIHFALKYW